MDQNQTLTKTQIRDFVEREVEKQLDARNFRETIMKLLTSEDQTRKIRDIAEKYGESAARLYSGSAEFKTRVKDEVENNFNKQVLSSPAYTLALEKSVTKLKQEAKVVVDDSSAHITAASRKACEALADAK